MMKTRLFPALFLSLTLMTVNLAWSDDLASEESVLIGDNQRVNNSNIDPYERYNRAMFGFNNKVDHYFFSPLARGYRSVTPKPVRAGVNNVFDNLKDVVSFGSNLLSLNIKKAGEDLARVGINTVFGLGGIINIADAGNMPNNKNSLGDTFASWGWENSNYFVYPLLGPSTVRDSLASTVMITLPPQNIFLESDKAKVALGAIGVVSTRENYLDITDGLNESALDEYAYMRDIYLSARAKQISSDAIDDSTIENIDIDDLVESNSSNDHVSIDGAVITDTKLPEQQDDDATEIKEYHLGENQSNLDEF